MSSPYLSSTLLLALSSLGWAADLTFTPASGDWTNGAHWSEGGTPVNRVPSGSDSSPPSTPGFTWEDNSTTTSVAYRCTASSIQPNPVTVTPSRDLSTTITYGDTWTVSGTAATSPLTWTTSDSTILGLSSTSGSSITVTAIGVGTGATVTATAPASGSYRRDSANTPAVTVGPKTVTVTVHGGTRTMGMTNPSPSITVAGLVGADTAGSLGTPNYSFVGTTPDLTSPAGSYPLTVAFTGGSANYSTVVVDGSLVITASSTTGGGTGGTSGDSGGGGCGVGGGLAALLGLALIGWRRQRT